MSRNKPPKEGRSEKLYKQSKAQMSLTFLPRLGLCWDRTNLPRRSATASGHAGIERFTEGSRLRRFEGIGETSFFHGNGERRAVLQSRLKRWRR
eukprot:SAG31_NODE_15489_length_752_cov_1.411945_2_plen_93_part_01